MLDKKLSQKVLRVFVDFAIANEDVLMEKDPAIKDGARKALQGICRMQTATRCFNRGPLRDLYVGKHVDGKVLWEFLWIR